MLKNYNLSGITEVSSALATKYKILSEISRDETAVVYKARQKNPNRLVVLKVLSQAYSKDKELLACFHRDAKLAANLKHPNIATVYGAGAIDNTHYVARQYIYGIDLQTIVEKRGKLNFRLVKKILSPILDALAYMHDQGMVHKHIKSSKIMVERKTGRIVLTDFGIALSSKVAKPTQTGICSGNSEAAKGGVIDRYTDLFSVGIVMYKMLTARLPFVGHTERDTLNRITDVAPLPPSKFALNLPLEAEKAVLRALEKRPEKRYQDARAFKRALFMKTAVAKKPNKPPPKKGGLASVMLKALSLTVIVCLVIGACIYVWGLPFLYRQFANKHENINLKQMLLAKDKQITELVRKIEGIDQKSDSYKPMLKNQESIILQMKTLAGNYTSEIESLRADIKKKDRQIFLLEQSGRNQNEKRIAYQSALIDKENVIRKINSAINLKEAEIRKKDDRIRDLEKKAETSNKDNRIKTRMKKLANLEPKQNKQSQPQNRSSDSKYQKTITNDLGMRFVLLSPGAFLMGSPMNELQRVDAERQHQVTLTQPFYMQTTEVTQGQWQKVMDSNPSYFKNCGANCPVDSVSWNDVREFIAKLNRQTGKTYGLPTEAQWEYACRAGTTTPFHTGTCLETSQANYKGENPYEMCGQGIYRRKPVAVAGFAPNAWGLYDMHGNVWEWCRDRYGEYPSGNRIDPVGQDRGRERVLRGGSWINEARDCRAAFRIGVFPVVRGSHIGFRLILISDTHVEPNK